MYGIPRRLFHRRDAEYVLTKFCYWENRMLRRIFGPKTGESNRRLRKTV
jgi:hypothetical protein